jgi:hypothetical protein
MDLIDQVHGKIVMCYEHGNEPSGSTPRGEFQSSISRMPVGQPRSDPCSYRDTLYLMSRGWKASTQHYYISIYVKTFIYY